MKKTIYDYFDIPTEHLRHIGEFVTDNAFTLGVIDEDTFISVWEKDNRFKIVRSFKAPFKDNIGVSVDADDLDYRQAFKMMIEKVI